MTITDASPRTRSTFQVPQIMAGWNKRCHHLRKTNLGNDETFTVTPYKVKVDVRILMESQWIIRQRLAQTITSLTLIRLITDTGYAKELVSISIDTHLRQVIAMGFFLLNCVYRICTSIRLVKG